MERVWTGERPGWRGKDGREPVAGRGQGTAGFIWRGQGDRLQGGGGETRTVLCTCKGQDGEDPGHGVGEPVA